MDIYECRDRYGITLRKLRKMADDGALRIEKDKTPEYWRMVVSDIQKGAMSARSIALAFSFPEKLERIATLTRSNRAVLETHFSDVELPGHNIEISVRFVAPLGVLEGHSELKAEFIRAVQKLIPEHEVRYQYIAARLLLTCDTDHQMNMMSESMRRAFAGIRDDPSMQGWWHKVPGKYGKKHIIYHRPRSYDL